MHKVLFIDRDGTLIVEPPEDKQVDSLAKLEFMPGVFRYLGQVSRELDYKLVIVTNQDGLGTDSFPEHTFWPAHRKMLSAFENEGIVFDDVLIDRTFLHENAPTRKPGTGLLTAYMAGGYNLAHSYVIGDRITDIELAKNLGAKGILYCTEIRVAEVLEREMAERGLMPHCALIAHSWQEIYEFLRLEERYVRLSRKTHETDISIELNLDGMGRADISTGLGFFDHMLSQIARHSGCDISIQVKGDLHVDEHHTIEDTAIALGEAFSLALGDKRGIERYGYALPMDDCLALVALDFGGRSWLVWEADFRREKVGEMPTEMFSHFFKSFADGARANLHIKAEGTNEHHKIEAIFKALAKAIKMAVHRNPNNFVIPSTKGTL